MSEGVKKGLSHEERERLIEQVIKELKIEKCVRVQGFEIKPFTVNMGKSMMPTGFIVVNTWIPFKLTRVEITIPEHMFTRTIFMKYIGDVTVRVEVIETPQMCYYDGDVIEPI
jgi:hypothetical protein